MSFINDGEQEKRDSTGAETAPTGAKEDSKKTKESKQGNPLLSLTWLVLIAVALYYIYPFITGDQKVEGFENLLEHVQSGDSVEAEEPVGELEPPRLISRELKPLLAEFKEAYEEMHDSLLLLQTKPKVKMINFSEDKQTLLFEIHSLAPSSGKKVVEDIIFTADDFGRLVTDGAYSAIRLHPEQ